MESLKSEAAGRAAGQRMETLRQTERERAKHMHQSQECSLALVNPGLDFEGV